MSRIIIGKYEATIYPEGNGYTGAISLGYGTGGKRKRIKRKGRTKEAVKDKLKEAADELDKGIKTDTTYTVEQCVGDFIAKGLGGTSPGTRHVYRSIADNHVIPKIGRLKVKRLAADDVDDWLASLATELSTETVHRAHILLTRSLRMAQRRDKVGRNVAELVDTPEGQTGRPSKSLTLDQAARLVAVALDPQWRLGAYTILCLMSGIRTEEARQLRWADVDLENAAVYVLRSDRHRGDTKTPKSRRGLGIAQMAVTALTAHKARQAAERLAAGSAWHDHDLVFCREDGAPLGPDRVRREFQKITKAAGIGADWVPRELRHTFVSLLSDHGVTIETIADLVGHRGTSTTETVYRHQLKPVITAGAEIMDQIFQSKNKSA